MCAVCLLNMLLGLCTNMHVIFFFLLYISFCTITERGRLLLYITIIMSSSPISLFYTICRAKPGRSGTAGEASGVESSSVQSPPEYCDQQPSS